jgi:hypothetical protein
VDHEKVLKIRPLAGSEMARGKMRYARKTRDEQAPRKFGSNKHAAERIDL